MIRDIAPFVLLFLGMLGAALYLVAAIRQDARLQQGRLFPQHVGTAVPHAAPRRLP